MKIKAVIGAAYGDEGKGLMTDYFSAQSVVEGRSAVVVRFNGGAQAGHTVVTPDGKRHVFHHIGSGAFTGARTFLAKPFIVNPMTFIPEFEELKTLLGKTPPPINAHSDCMVTLPHDMIFNQLMEKQRQQERGLGRHGSCGMGINATVERCEKFETNRFDDSYTLENLLAMSHEDVAAYCNMVLEMWYMPLMDRWLVEPTLRAQCERLMRKPELLAEFTHALDYFDAHVATNRDFISNLTHDSDLIFEGAQGLLLDQGAEGFPFLTRSNTGLRNAAHILKDVDVKFDFEVVYVTRAYATRHGAGPLKNEAPMPVFVVDPTNVPNAFQGTLRYAPLDLDVYDNAIDVDSKFFYKIRDLEQCGHAELNRAITCLDQVIGQREVAHTFNRSQHVNPGPLFVRQMADSFSYCSFGPTRLHVWRRDEIKHYDRQR